MHKVLLLGSTDVTLAVADAVLRTGVGIEAIVSAGESFDISYSDRPVRNVRFADIPTWCAQHGTQVLRFNSYEQIAGDLECRDIPVCLVAGWYHMLPRRFRDRFERSCIGFHASLLPQLRGGAPLNWAILAGLSNTGVTMLQLADGIDDGPIFGRRSFPIGPRSTIAELVAKSGEACVSLVGEFLPAIIAGQCMPHAQSGEPSYGLQRQPEDGRIKWTWTAEAIDRLVRAVGRPYGGAFCEFAGQRIHVWRTEPLANGPRVHGIPGQILRLPSMEHPGVVTGDGILVIFEATDEGGRCALPLLRRSSQKRFAVD